MIQPGFFDLHNRLHSIDKNGDPLAKLNEAIDWELFQPTIEAVRKSKRTSIVGPKGYDAILLFKILILQSLYNLSDEVVEYQILDRLSFGRFLALDLSERVPDCTTIWRFREDLTEAGVIEQLFTTFDVHLRTHGFLAMKGQIVDASIVSAPKQRNSRDENAEIKQGIIPKWPINKRRQKDVDARWTKKNNKTFNGYKNHISIDVKYKLIRSYAVTDASLHDSQCFEQLLTENTSQDVWADSAYRSKERLSNLQAQGFREHIQKKGTRHRPLTAAERAGNTTRSRVRSRVEHVFGVQAQKAGTLLLRTIGIARAQTKIGLRNLAYNIDRVGMLMARYFLSKKKVLCKKMTSWSR